MSLERPARLRLYEVSAQALLLWLQSGARIEVVEGIPPGGEVVDQGYDPVRQVFYMTVEHQSFKDVHEGMEIPQDTVTLERWDREEEEDDGPE